MTSTSNKKQGNEGLEMGVVGAEHALLDKHKDDLVKYMSNGNKTKLMTSGLLNTAALSTNASLLALIMKLEKMNTAASISLCLIVLSVTLQLMTAILTLLEYRATLIVDRDPEKLWRRRTLKMGVGRNGKSKKSPIRTDNTNGDGANNENPNGTEITEPYSFCKPMELQFSVAMCTVVLTVVLTEYVHNSSYEQH